MTAIGYARVSTDGQSLQSQTEALHLAGCGRVYSEKISGALAIRRREAGETLTSIAQLFGVSHMTIARIANDDAR
jgi:DNA invertase Pin-like site-specific DNA recombinase